MEVIIKRKVFPQLSYTRVREKRLFLMYNSSLCGWQIWKTTENTTPLLPLSISHTT